MKTSVVPQSPSHGDALNPPPVPSVAFILELEAHIEALEQPWISVETDLPEDGYLCVVMNGTPLTAEIDAYHKGNGWSSRGPYTHWFLVPTLPAPPEQPS